MVDKQIWDFLKSKGLNDYAVAGLMGNLFAESGLRSNNLQNSYEKSLGMTDQQYTERVDNRSYTNFIYDKAGYGLAQWTYWRRKRALFHYARLNKVSIGNLEMQLEFLWKELQGYKSVINVLNTSTSIKQASNAVLLDFEQPADQSESVQQKRAEYGRVYYDKYTKEVGKVTNKQLATKLLNIAKNYKTLYIMGCFGAPMNAANKKRYKENYTYNSTAARRKMIDDASANTFGFDCVCLIKGVLWGWNGDTSKQYGGATYASNGVPDINADQMIERCNGVSTNFSNIKIGEAVWMIGHIGIYVGDGLVVECSPKWENKVQVTALLNIGPKSGHNGRRWTKHGKLPYITYEASTPPTTSGPKKTNEQIANEVIQGKWGNGDDRKKNLTAEGYNYLTIQSIVNAILRGQTTKTIEQIALEVIQGKWGNGNDRINNLKAKGYDPTVVQKKVNELLKG